MDGPGRAGSMIWSMRRCEEVGGGANAVERFEELIKIGNSEAISE